MKDDIIIIDNVSKDFRLPHQKIGSVKNIFTNLFSMGGRTYEVQHALKDISFEVKKGEFFGIVGRNGSGKSTLLKILAGIYQPTKGSVHVGGRVVPFIELGVGFNGELTGKENVFLNGALMGFSEKEITAKYNEIVEFAELKRFMDQKLKNYSSGMQVRLAFSVATRLAESDILLIDEVLAVGDAAFQRKCFNYFKKLKLDKKTVIFVTHDMAAVREYCDKAALIQDGNIIVEGKPERVADEYLKLFNNEAEKAVSQSEDQQRWGNGFAKFESVTAKRTHEKLQVETVIKCNKKSLEGVVVGIRVFDAEDKIIAGVNTKNATNRLSLTLSSAGSIKLKFELPNVFSSGTYNIGATIRLSDGVTICDDWKNAAIFTNISDSVPYPVICPATIVVERNINKY